MKTRDKDLPEFTITHQFDAPKKLVFDSFSKLSALNEWWGPVECKTTGMKLDFHTGGIFHYKMEDSNWVRYGRFTFGKIRPYDLLEFTNSFADDKGNIIPAPFNVPLPLEIFYRLTFRESNGKTTITLTGKGINATREQIESLISIRSSMETGFAATFSQLENYLSHETP